MDWEIRPYDGIGPLNFGMTLDEVGNCLALPVRIVDALHSLLANRGRARFGDYIFAGFDSDGVSQAFAISPPLDALLLGKRLLSESISGLEEWLQAVDSNVHVTAVSIIAPSFGLALYAPHRKYEPDEVPESLTVYSRTEFDKFRGMV